MSKEIILVDRSRYELSQVCEREYYWHYLYGGRGIQARGTPSYFVVGQAVHTGIQLSMLGKEWEDVKTAVLDEFSSLELTDEQELLAGESLQEQKDLAVALVFVWRKQRMPTFLAEYEPLTIEGKALIEQEIVVDILETEQYIVRLMSRPDVIVRRISDKAILNWELKTTGLINGRWIKKWTHALQLLLQVFATSSLLTSLHVKGAVVGVVVEGLSKGVRKRDTAGVKRYQNSLIYGYVKRGDGFIIKDQWTHTWRKGLSRALVSPEIPLEEWIQALPEEELLKYCAAVPPLLADDDTVASTLRQVGHRSILLHERNKKFNKAIERTIALDELFPQNTNACHAMADCPFIDVCFQHTIGEDPIGSGKYEEREPNHVLELDS